MTFPSLWKIKREVRRIGDQTNRLASNLYEIPVRANHSRWLIKIARPLPGKRSLGKKVAIFVLFQPKGVAASVFLTCDHLIAQGYSIFILSNGPLSDSDRFALIEKSSLLLVRPNFGYDFGAYQDGIYLLDRMGCKLNNLIVMNDSTWFPLRSNDTSIRRMEASIDAFTGHILRNEPDIRRGQDHIESHLLMFKKNAFESAAFKYFWDNYKMSSNRIKTILTGEKLVSAAMFDAGFFSKGLVSRAQFLDCLDNAPFDILKRILTETSFRPVKINDNLAFFLSVAEDTPVWRKQVHDHCSKLLVHLSPIFSTTFVYGTMTTLQLGFVKKSNEECFHLTRKKVLELEASGEIPVIDPTVRAEIAASVSSWKRQ